jgi:tetratricopeptide (TPR) repeat protein
MSKPWVFLLFILAPFLLKAQRADLDSINQANLDRIRQMDKTVITDLHAARVQAFSSEDRMAFAGSLKNLAGFYIVFDQRDSALHYLDEGLDEVAIDTLSPVRASLFINKGILLYQMGKNDESYSLYLKALRIAESNSDSMQAANILLNMALTDTDLKRFDQAVERNRQALKWRDEGWFQANVHLNIGVLFSQMGDTIKAIENYQQAIEQAQLSESPAIMANSKFNLANILSVTENIHEARLLYSEALEVFNQYNMIQGQATTYSAFGTMEFREKNYQEALDYYLRCLELSSGFPRLHYEVQTNVALTYAKLGEFEEAYTFLDQSFVLRDSLTGADKQAEIERLEKEFQLDKIQFENEREQLEAAQRELRLSRRIAWLSAGLTLSFLLIVFLFFRRSQRRLKAEKSEVLAKQEKEQLEMQLLRSQMNPHFFFNALYSIQNFILTNEPLESSRFLSKFARLMRATLEWSEKELIPLEKEIEVLSDYLQLEQLRFDEKFTFRVDCEAQFKSEFLIPPMIVQPFVENAIVHGFRHMEKGGKLEISFRTRGESLYVIVTDNGQGLEASRSAKSHIEKESLALRLTRKRLELLGYKYNFGCELQLFDRSKEEQNTSGVRVEMRIPLIKD